MKKFFLLIIFLLIFFEYNLTADSNNQLLIKANLFYSKGQYNKAIIYYKRIFKKGVHNGYLFYNIGTSYLKQNKLGYALFWYNKAKFFIPLNTKLIKNINIANNKIKSPIKGQNVSNYINDILFFNKIFGIHINYKILIFIFYVTIIFIILLLFIKKNILNSFLKKISVFSLILFIFCLINFIWQYYSYKFFKIGYVTENNSPLNNDFSKNAKIILNLNDGQKVYIINETKNFYYIKLPNAIEGWIKKKFIISNSKID